MNMGKGFVGRRVGRWEWSADITHMCEIVRDCSVRKHPPHSPPPHHPTPLSYCQTTSHSFSSNNRNSAVFSSEAQQLALPGLGLRVYRTMSENNLSVQANQSQMFCISNRKWTKCSCVHAVCLSNRIDRIFILVICSLPWQNSWEEQLIREGGAYSGSQFEVTQSIALAEEWGSWPRCTIGGMETDECWHPSCFPVLGPLGVQPKKLHDPHSG